MYLASHRSLPPLLLLSPLLSLFLGTTNGMPLVTETNIVHAIQPSCTTFQDGSSTCNVGINTAPPLVSLDGGYQWLTVTPTTTTESGSTVTTNEAVWTAVQTSYLDIISVTTTDANGATTVSASTEYVSFITTTTTPPGAAPTAVIGAIVMAPAVVAILQPIINNAAGKTPEAIGGEIVAALSQVGISESIGNAGIIAAAILAIGGVVGEASSLYQPYVANSYFGDLNIAAMDQFIDQPSPTGSSPSSTTSEVAFTAIMDPPYSNYRDLQVVITAVGPTPTDDDFATSTSTSAPTAECTPSNTGADVGAFAGLAVQFCNSLNLTQSSSKSLQVPGANGPSILFNFNQTNTNCTLGCVPSFAQIVQTCEFNGHSIYGAASLEDSCGTFAMSISSPPAASTTAAPPPPSPTPTLSPPALQGQQCYDRNKFGNHGDIAGNAQSSWANDFCNQYNKVFESGTAPATANGISIIYNDSVSPYHYAVSWIDGCQTTAANQSMKQPLGPGNTAVTCQSLLTDDWKNCNNGGVGGYRDAGCLRYTFACTKDKTFLF